MMLPDHCHQLRPVTHAGDLLVVQAAADKLATDSLLSNDQRSRFSLIIAELGTNLIRHTQGGMMLIRTLTAPAGLECICYDRGPGIPDVAAALRDGQSTGTGLGLGLGAVRRLSDEFEIHSEPKLGTAILARVRSGAPHVARIFQSGAVMVPMRGMDHCGDGWIVTADGVVAVIDGLGHGEEASIAARRAEASVAAGHADPRRTIDAMHLALRGTRGAVAMVICADENRIQYTGVGNIAAALIGVDRVVGLHSAWGVVGSKVPPQAPHQVPWNAGDVLLLNTDGLARTVDVFLSRHLRYVDPTLAAAVVHRDATTKLDDQTVFVMRQMPARRRWSHSVEATATSDDAE